MSTGKKGNTRHEYTLRASTRTDAASDEAMSYPTKYVKGVRQRKRRSKAGSRPPRKDYRAKEEASIRDQLRRHLPAGSLVEGVDPSIDGCYVAGHTETGVLLSPPVEGTEVVHMPYDASGAELRIFATLGEAAAELGIDESGLVAHSPTGRTNDAMLERHFDRLGDEGMRRGK